MPKSNIKSNHQKTGFTIIEVMLVLAISALLLIGVIAGAYLSISNNRYNDTVRSFAEYLRSIYGEALSPESLGNGDDDSSSFGNSNDLAIYGKVVVFGLPADTNGERRIYSATLVGDPDVPPQQQNFMQELKAVHARLFCGETRGSITLNSTVASYLPLWQSQIDNTNQELFVGTVIIARSPTSGIVHTTYAPGLVYDLQNECQPSGNQAASTRFSADIQNNPTTYRMNEDIDFCVESQDNKIVRNVRLLAGARNSSGVSIIDADGGDSRCQNR